MTPDEYKKAPHLGGQDGELGDDSTDCEDDDQCLYCGGDGMDPYCDYLLPCPYCNGQQYP